MWKKTWHNYIFFQREKKSFLFCFLSDLLCASYKVQFVSIDFWDQSEYAKYSSIKHVLTKCLSTNFLNFATCITKSKVGNSFWKQQDLKEEKSGDSSLKKVVDGPTKWLKKGRVTEMCGKSLPLLQL